MKCGKIDGNETVRLIHDKFHVARLIIIIIIIECWTQEVTHLCPDLQFRDVALLCSHTSLLILDFNGTSIFENFEQKEQNIGVCYILPYENDLFDVTITV